MHRFYLPPEFTGGDTLQLQGQEAHHASHVLRLRKGDDASVLDGKGTELFCEVTSLDRKSVGLVVRRRNLVPALPYRITLFQAVPKGKLLEAVIQKATELGVARIVPLLTDRVATRLDDETALTKKDKWQQVAVEAIKQCGSTWLPEIEAPANLNEVLLRNGSFDLPLIASLQPGSRHAREYFQSFRTQHGCQPQSVCIWVGPEGDFTPEEVAAIQKTGAQPITLGRLVLRVETAATYCLSILNHELQAS